MGLIEFIFLWVSITRKGLERDKVCTADPVAGKNLKLALSITIVLHGLHVSRLIHRVITSYYKKRNIVGGIIRCLLMDCYCTCAFFIYCFVQICYYANWKKCINLTKPTHSPNDGEAKNEN